MAKTASMARARVKKEIQKNVKTINSARADAVGKMSDPGFRMDGWANVLTGLGQINRDKNLSTIPQVEFMTQPIAEALYQTDDIASKIVDYPVEEMFREGFKINIPQDDGEQSDWIFSRLDALKAIKAIENQMKLGRLYGTACIFYGKKGAMTPNQPAKPGQAVDYLRVISRYRLNPSSTTILDLSAEDFGFPVSYSLTGRAGDQGLVIDKSWLYRFDGVVLPEELRIQNNNFGDSVLSRIYRILQIFNAAYYAVGGVVQDFNTPVFKLKNLVDMIAQNKEEKIIQRMALAMLTSSVFKGIVLQDDESYERANSTVTGVDSLVKLVKERLATAANMPHTILFNEGSGGSLGGTGVSEKTDWYDKIKSMQTAFLTPALMDVITRICEAPDSQTDGKLPEGLTIEYFPLWQASEKEQAETRKIIAETDNIYIAAGVLYPDEVTTSRFGSGEYSPDTKIDLEARKKFEEDDKLLTEEDGNFDEPNGDTEQDPAAEDAPKA